MWCKEKYKMSRRTELDSVVHCDFSELQKCLVSSVTLSNLSNVDLSQLLQ